MLTTRAAHIYQAPVSERLLSKLQNGDAKKVERKVVFPQEISEDDFNKLQQRVIESKDNQKKPI